MQMLKFHEDTGEQLAWEGYRSIAVGYLLESRWFRYDLGNYHAAGIMAIIEGMKVRICFLVMSLAAVIYYGALQLAPAGRAATVSSGFHQVGKAAFEKIDSAQEASTESESVFQTRIADADRMMTIANGAAISAADRREFVQLFSYLQAVKQDHMLMQASSDPAMSDHQQLNSARENAERTFK